MRRNGRQMIYQMIQLAERIRERGGVPRELRCYKQEYLCQLEGRIAGRKEGLRRGTIRPEELLVFGAVPLLEQLAARGAGLYLASGTDEPSLVEEANLLGLTRFFGRHIYGALEDYQRFSKKIVIERILRENGINGDWLLSLGDGCAEIQDTKEVGGLAVAVASDETHNGSGPFDEWKRRRLLEVGADVVIADFRDARELLAIILGEAPKTTAK